MKRRRLQRKMKRAPTMVGKSWTSSSAGFSTKTAQAVSTNCCTRSTHYPRNEKWRDVDEQDKQDIPKKVLARWRVDHPAEGVRWTRGKGVSDDKFRIIRDRTKAGIMASLSTVSSSSSLGFDSLSKPSSPRA
jgi:hypothetical protein